MAGRHATAADLARGVPAYAGRKNTVVLVPRGAEVLQGDQFSFSFNSCVLLPRPSPRRIAKPVRTGLTLVADILVYAETDSMKDLVLAGHTDTVGSDADNLKVGPVRRLRHEHVRAAR